MIANSWEAFGVKEGTRPEIILVAKATHHPPWNVINDFLRRQLGLEPLHGWNACCILANNWQ
jgi:hypothetical protein